MKIYLIRHGESEGNAKNICQYPTEPLTPNGIKQANIVANRFKNIAIDMIVSSPNNRAHDTAKIIGKTIRKPLIASSLFIEKYGSTKLYGLDKDDETAKIVMKDLQDNIHDPNYRHSDEETFLECRNRAKKALSFLLEQKKESILVVTHGTFIKTMLGVMLFGDDFSSHDYIRFKHFFMTNNTGITVCLHNQQEGWGLVSWNDHAHLG